MVTIKIDDRKEFIAVSEDSGTTLNGNEEVMMIITDNLIAELKLFIKERYKIVSFMDFFTDKKRVKKQSISKKANGI